MGKITSVSLTTPHKRLVVLWAIYDPETFIDEPFMSGIDEVCHVQATVIDGLRVEYDWLVWEEPAEGLMTVEEAHPGPGSRYVVAAPDWPEHLDLDKYTMRLAGMEKWAKRTWDSWNETRGDKKYVPDESQQKIIDQWAEDHGTIDRSKDFPIAEDEPKRR